MLNIKKIDHIGIRINDKDVSIGFYKNLGFKTTMDAGFEDGHPIIMNHYSGVTINLLGPSNAGNGSNILMDNSAEKHPGITHFALEVSSLEDAENFLTEHNIEITGRFTFGKMSALFIRDPDRNVIELDAYAQKESSPLPT